MSSNLTVARSEDGFRRGNFIKPVSPGSPFKAKPWSSPIDWNDCSHHEIQWSEVGDDKRSKETKYNGESEKISDGRVDVGYQKAKLHTAQCTATPITAQHDLARP